MALRKQQMYCSSISKHFFATSSSCCNLKQNVCSSQPFGGHHQPLKINARLRRSLSSSTSTLSSTFVIGKHTHNLLNEPSICGCRKISTRLSPNEVTTIVRANESTLDITFNSIKSFDTNQLPANTPIEDTKVEARCLLTTGMLFGVFDGHGGPACAQVVAKRLVYYIAAALLPTDALNKFLSPLADEDPRSHLLELYHDHFDLVQDLHQLYLLNFGKYLKDLKAVNPSEFLMRTTLQKTFIRLDEDIAKEAIDDELLSAAISAGDKVKQKQKVDKNLVDSLQRKTLSIAESGAVGCIAHIDGEHLHVASVGDCRAVLGLRDPGETNWVALPLTKPHNSENLEEVQRLQSEHPEEERETVVQNDRLLGQLAPLRAFGDVRFKWTKEVIRQKLSPYLGDQAIIQNSITPPYLTASPDVTYHKLRPQDRFLILGTDGLWDFLSPNEAVRLVGEHMSGKTILSPFSLPKTQDAIPLRIIHETLMRRAESFKVKPIDSNAATHLIRHALGCTDYGLDHQRIAHFLSLPKDTVRLFRDDITCTVIFFDSDYLRQRPL